MDHFCGLRDILLQKVVNVVRIGMPVYVGPPRKEETVPKILDPRVEKIWRIQTRGVALARLSEWTASACCAEVAQLQNNESSFVQIMPEHAGRFIASFSTCKLFAFHQLFHSLLSMKNFRLGRALQLAQCMSSRLQFVQNSPEHAGRYSPMLCFIATETVLQWFAQPVIRKSSRMSWGSV